MRRRLPEIPRIRIGVVICDAVVSFFVRRRQFFLVRIDHEHGQQLSGFGLAGVLTNAVPVTGHLGEALPGVIRNGSIISRFEVSASCVLSDAILYHQVPANGVRRLGVTPPDTPSGHPQSETSRPAVFS